MTQHDERDPLTLSPKDAAALDSLLESGGGVHLRTTRDPDEQSQRAARAAAWLKILGAAPTPESPAGLAERTLAAVAEDRMKLQPAAARGGGEPQVPFTPAEAPRPRSRRLYEIAAMLIAAMLLFAVFIPSLATARRSANRVTCAANLKGVGTGFAVYGAAFNHELPSLALPANGNWLHGDSETAARSNTANLLPLITGKYVKGVESFFCAGRPAPPSDHAITLAKNDLPELGYSYVNLYGPSRPSWDGAASTLILADRNPLFVGESASNLKPDANSPNHGGQGNYVVHADQSVSWDMSPNIGPGGDNIWTIGSGPQRRLNYIGTEVPATSGDVFIAP